MNEKTESHPVVIVSALISSLIPKYLDICRREVSELAGLLEQGELEEVQRRGHNLKGSGAAYGFVEASRLGGLLEEAVEGHDLEQVAVLCNSLGAYFDTVEVRTK